MQFCAIKILPVRKMGYKRGEKGEKKGIKRGYQWVVKTNSMQYFTISILACVDGNAFASAASGVFNSPSMAMIFGLLCFSGVGCITALISSTGSRRDKVLGIFFTRLLTLVMGTMAVFSGLYFGYSFELSRYIAAVVVLTVSFGVALAWLPKVKIGRVTLSATLIALVLATVITLPFGHLKFQVSEFNSSEILGALVGLIIAVSFATLLDLLVVLSSRLVEKYVNLADLRLVGFIVLTLLAIGPIGGLISLSSYWILGLFLGTIPILVLRKKKLNL